MARERSEPGHLEDVDLIRFMDGEASRNETARAKAHLKHCWTCQQRLAAIRSTVAEFIELSRDATEHVGPPQHWSRFQKELVRQSKSAYVKPQRAPMVPRAATAAGALACLWFLFAPNSKPALEATVLLDRSTNAQMQWARGASDRVVHQTLQVRGHSGAQSIWEIWHAPRRRRSVTRWSGSKGVAERTAEAYGRAGLAYNDPLSAKAFGRLRDGLRDRRDHIEIAGGEITLRTFGTGGDVASASLTIRASDWRPLRQHLDFTPSSGLGWIEVDEIGYAEISLAEAPPELREEGAPPRSVADGQPISPSRVEPVDPALLENSEARLRMALHQLGFDTSLTPLISRTAESVRLDLIVESTSAREAVFAAAGNLPHTDLHVYAPGDSIPTGLSATANAARVLQRTEPPLAKLLQEHLGGTAAAEAYIRTVHSRYRVALVPSLALEDLSRRYPEGVFGQLPAEAGELIRRLAFAYATEASWRSLEYAEALDVAVSLSSSQSKGASSGIAVHVPWQSTARLLATRLRSVDAAFNRLFVTHEQAFDTAADSGRGDLGSLRSDLQSVIQSVAQTQGASPHDH